MVSEITGRNDRSWIGEESVVMYGCAMRPDHEKFAVRHGLGEPFYGGGVCDAWPDWREEIRDGDFCICIYISVSIQR